MALGTSNLVGQGTGAISSLLPNNKPLQIGTSTGMGNQTTTSPIQPHNQPGVLATSLGSDVSQIAGAIGSVLSPLTNATSSVYGALTPQQPAQAPVAPFSIPSSPSTSNSSGIPSGGLPLASGVTPITNVAEATAAGAAAANQNQNTSGNTQTTNQTNTSGTPGAVSSVFPGVTQSLAGIQPAPSVAAAGQNLLNTANSTQTGPASVNQNNIQGGAQTSANISQNQTPAVTGAYQNLLNFNKNEPLIAANQAALPMAANVSAGRGQILGNQLAATEQGLANTYNAAVQGEGQQVTAAGQQGTLGVSGQQNQNTAAQNAGALANTAQANQIQAQTAAGTLTQPTPAGYGQTVFNPQTGTYSNGGGGAQPGDPMYSALQDYAQGLKNNTTPYSSIPSSITSNPILNNQLLQMAGQGGTSGTGFNLNQSMGTSGAQQQGQANITLMNSANTAAQGIQQTIQQFLAQNPAINSSPFNLENAAEQWLGGKQLSDPTYQTLFNYLNEYTNTLAPILGVGGDTTNLKTEIAQGFINSAASGQSISQVLDSIGTLATRKIQNLQSGLNGGGVVSGTGTSPNTTGASQFLNFGT